MPRGRTSEADLLLIAELAVLGIEVSPYQLERWRAAGQLPKPERRWPGRGQGSTSRYPEGTIDIAATLDITGAQGRSRHLGTLVLFRAGMPVDEHAVRIALYWVVDDHQRRVRQREEADEYYTSKLAERAAKAITVDFPPLLAVAPAVGATSGQLRERARRRKESKRFVGAKVQMKYGAVSSHGLEDDLAPLGPKLAAFFSDMVRESEAQIARGAAPAAAPDSGATRWADRIPFDRIVAARDVLQRVVVANTALHVLAEHYEDARELIALLGTEAMFAELVMLPGTLANPVALPLAFAEMVLSFIVADAALVQAAIYAWFVDSMVAAPVRGIEAIIEHAEREGLDLPEHRTYQQIETIGRLFLREAGHEPAELDLVAVMEQLNIEATPWIKDLQAEWERLLALEDEDDPPSQASTE